MSETDFVFLQCALNAQNFYHVTRILFLPLCYATLLSTAMCILNDIVTFYTLSRQFKV